jgi:hypothetical protein
VLARGLAIRLLLQVIRQHDCGDPPIADGDANGAVDEMPHLRRRKRLLDERASNVLEQTDKVYFLLVVAAERVARLLSYNGEHRHVIEPRVVEPGYQVRGARPRGRDANTELARELGVGARHKRRHFLVPRLDESDLVTGPILSAPNTPLMPTPG